MGHAADQTWQDWVGRTSEATDTVTPRLVDCFRASLSPYLDETDPTAVPLGLHWCLAPEIVGRAALGKDGHALTGSFLPPMQLPQRMWASSELQLLAPLHSGDAVRRRSVIREIQPKQGRTGPLCFVTVQHQLSNARGPVLEERHVIVYRDSANAAAPAGGAEKPIAGTHQTEVAIDPVMLFRYSALTFNAHRIHYDFRYTSEVAHYPDLVIHGPLQATLLMNFAARIAGRAPRSFAIRALRVATGSQNLRLRAAEASTGELALEAQATDGTVTIRADAAW